MQYIGGTNPENLNNVTSASREQKTRNSNDLILTTIYNFKANLQTSIIKQNNSQNSKILNNYEIILIDIYNHLIFNTPILHTNIYNINKEIIDTFIGYIKPLIANNNIDEKFINYYLKENFKTCPYAHSEPAQEQCKRYNQKSQP